MLLGRLGRLLPQLARRGLDFLAGQHQGVADAGRIQLLQMAVEAACQAGRVPVRDGGLHGDHHGEALRQQILSEAQDVFLSAAAVAGGQKDERRGAPGLADGVAQILRRHRDGATFLILHLDPPRQSVTGDVQHVKVLTQQRFADFIGMADFEDLGQRLLPALSLFERIENGLQLAFEVERIGLSLVFVGGADGHQDPERAGRRFERCRFAQEPAGLTQAGLQGQGPCLAGQDGRLEGPGEDRVVLALPFEQDLAVSLQLPLDHVRDSIPGLTGKENPPQIVSQLDQCCLSCALRFPPRLATQRKAVGQEICVGKVKADSRLGRVLFGYRLVLKERLDADLLALQGTDADCQLGADSRDLPSLRHLRLSGVTEEIIDNGLEV